MKILVFQNKIDVRVDVERESVIVFFLIHQITLVCGACFAFD